MDNSSRSKTVNLTPTFLGVAIALLLCATLIIVGLVQRPAGGLGVPPGSHVVHVDEFDYGFRMPSGPLPAGEIVLVDTNRGSIPHELVMFKTANANAKMPMRKDGDVDEESSSLEAVMDSGSSLAPGESRIITAELEPGTYVIVCNLPAHFRLGMHQLVTVK